MKKNKLYFGDNLEILRDKINDKSVDLIYLDPPFNSKRNYNIIFKPKTDIKTKEETTSQIQAFSDTWKWSIEAENCYTQLIEGTLTKEKPNQRLIDYMKSMRGLLGECTMMAYLANMAPRLLEMKRVLKDTGSIYLHCDPTASHYLKLLMDSIFGIGNFQNEIIWHYNRWTNASKNFQRRHDIILFYSKKKHNIFNKIGFKKTSKIYHTNTVSGKNTRISQLLVYNKDAFDKLLEKNALINKYDRVVYVSKEESLDDVWGISILNSQSKERVGYPTQKPEALLERIIKTSSNKSDVVLDPFCGCGTAVAVAEKLGRKWIGIDITYLAIDVIEKRFEKSKLEKEFEIDGVPNDVYSARKLARKDPFQFQIWCIAKLGGTQSQRKTGDGGVDGTINFVDYNKKAKMGKGIVQVKGTKEVNPAMVRELKGTIRSQCGDFGILITLKKPTQGMVSEAVKEGYYKYPNGEITKIQLLTVQQLLKNPMPIKLPPLVMDTYKPQIIEKERAKQLTL